MLVIVDVKWHTMAWPYETYRHINDIRNMENSASLLHAM